MRTAFEISNRMTELHLKKSELARDLFLTTDRDKYFQNNIAQSMIDAKLEEYFWLMQPLEIDPELDIRPGGRLPDNLTIFTEDTNEED